MARRDLGPREQVILQDIRSALGRLPWVRVSRNNVGTLRDERGVPISYGLGIGSADLIGLIAPMGRYFAVEVKRPHTKQSDEQIEWQRMIVDMGGVYVVARCARDACEAALVDTSAYPCVWSNLRRQEVEQALAAVKVKRGDRETRRARKLEIE